MNGSNLGQKIKKNKSLAKAAEELAILQSEMKSLAKKYSKAKGQEKENLLNILKSKTKLKKELERLQTYLGGVKNMKRIPDVVVLIDQQRELTAIKECRKLNIPIISLVDTNCDPDLITYPIPGNDDAVRSLKLILKSLTDNINLGRSQIR